MHDIPATLHEILAGRYVLKREIGRGGAATVYLAHDIRHERLVAIKVLHPELSHALGVQRFLREIKLTAGLQHPHILPIHDSGEADGQLYYVMPYVEGDSLRQRLGADNRLSLQDAVRVGREVAGALAYAHERGVVHRDIKPENILFSGGHAVLADFGIARAINRAHEKITHQGTITGTPAYMSPEQARDREFDGRSDVYSLACVLYEAIAGVPPFVGDTPAALLQQRISRPAPLLREFRHDVPPPIEAVIARALAISPDDRYDDARAFSAALSAAIGNSGETLSTRAAPRAFARDPRVWAAGIAMLVVAGAATSPRARDQFGALASRVDTTQYAVVPFSYVGSPAPSPELEPVAQGLYSALREWNGLHVASDVRVLDALRDQPDRSLEGMQAVARSVHAGRLVWGRVWLQHDSLRVRVDVYDAIDGTSLREVTATGRGDEMVTRAGGMSGLVAELLRADGGPELAPGADAGTRSLEAWHAYDDARRALDGWRIPAARVALERAIAADPGFARPRVWLAQLLLWRDAPASTWTPHLNVARRGHATLPVREALISDALEPLAHGNAKGACAAYDRLRGVDSLDAAAWLGLSYCQGLDRLVVPDRRSPTGFAFQGSVQSAQRAYAQAVRIAPGSFGAFAFELVAIRIFAIESNRIRAGYTADSALFVGEPGLAGDTIAFVAHPFRDLAAMPTDLIAPHHHEALMRNRDALRELLSTLTQRIPDDPNVFEALTQVLESRDEITGTPNGGYSALSALERAKMLAVDTTQRARLGAADARLHLKLGDFSRAVAVGDSMLTAMPGATGSTAITLAGVAALLGREHDAVHFVRASGMSTRAGPGPDVPLVEDAATALLMRTALGVCDDSTRSLLHRVTTLLESYVGPAELQTARLNMLQRPISLGADCFGAAATLALRAPTMLIVRVQQTIARGNLALARLELDSLQATRRSLRPGEFTIDATLIEAMARAATGDTAGAIRQLDLTLTALPTLNPHIVAEPGMAAAMGRSMVFRADLAARTGDRGTAALWAGRVLTLWARADRSLAPTLARMRLLAAQPS